MSNGDYILNDLEFERKIEGMEDRKLMEYTARLAYSSAVKCYSLERRINGRMLTKKTTGFLAGAGALIGGIGVGIADYFMKRGG